MATGRECSTSPWTDGRMAVAAASWMLSGSTSSPRLFCPRAQLMSAVCSSSVMAALPSSSFVIAVLRTLKLASVSLLHGGSHVFRPREIEPAVAEPRRT